MIEFNDSTYAAIVTIELPGMDQPETVSVTLAPADTVQTASGQVKALRDCTLADLAAFAETLEADVWQAYQAITLPALAADETARLKITLLTESGTAQQINQDKWLEHAILLQPSPPGAREDDETASQQIPQSPPVAKERPQAAEQVVSEKTPGTKAEQPQELQAVPTEQEVAEAEEPAEELAVESPTEPQPESDFEPTVETADEEPAESEALPAAPTPEAAEEVAPLEKPVVEGVEPAVVRPASPPPARKELRILGLRRPVGHSTRAAVDILINEAAFRDAQAHSLSSLDREVAGMLIGPQPEKQPDGRYIVHITDVIVAKHTRMAGASVTYTPESWRYVTDVLHERYPNEEALIVGWYHTHPGFGIFLSGMDLFIHQNFFTQKWHVALVLDPVAQRSGFFCWDRQQTAVQPYEFPWPPWAASSW